MKHWLETVVELLEADTSDLRQLAKLAGGDPSNFYLGTDLYGADLRGQNLLGMKFSAFDPKSVVVDEDTKLDPEYAALFPKIISQESKSAYELAISEKAAQTKRVARQESRIAILLREIMLDRDRGMDLLSTYGNDRAEFAKKALEYTHALFSRNPNLPTDSLVREAVYFSISYIYGMRKGVLLLSLADYLGEFPSINAAIKSKTSHSFSMYVAPHKQDILNTLKVRLENRM